MQKISKTSSLVLASWLIASAVAHGQAPTNSSTLPAAPAPNSSTSNEEMGKTKLDITAYIRSQSIEDKVVNSKYAGGILLFDGERHFTSYLSGSLSFAGLFMTGSYTNRYTAEGAAPSGFDFYSAIVDLHPADWISLQMGVLETEFSSLVSTFFVQGFPGAKAILKSKGDMAEISLAGSQTIPTSPTPEVKSSESGVNTTLNLSTLTLASNPADKADLTVKASATHFQFNNLTSSAATDSQYLGNTVSIVGSQARFKYGFTGNEYSGLATLKATKKLKLTVSGSQLVNDLAPTEQNKAQIMKGSFTYAQNGINWTLGGGAFSNESDTLPASYTTARQGYNNRFGYMGNFTIEFEKKKTKVFGNFVQANVIDGENKPYQADRQVISIGMEAKYEIF